MRNIEEDIQNLYRMSNIERFTGTFHHQKYNITEHCYRTAILFKLFASIEDVPYGMYEFDIVLQHDIVETLTGDLIYPVKNFSDKTKEAWAIIEEELTAGKGIGRYTDENIKKALNYSQFKLFKCCDYLELLIYCASEIILGNNSSEIIETKNKCITLIKEYGKEFPNILTYIQKYE